MTQPSANLIPDYKVGQPVKGLLVAVEGIDGAGKTTLIEGLRNTLPSPVETTREPTDLPPGRLARERLKTNAGPDGLAEAAIDAEYFAADRIWHNAAVIGPAMARGAIVLCDRYDLGALAYQATQGLPLDYLLAKRASLVRLGLVAAPDLTLLLDVPAKQALERISARGHREKFERELFLEKVRQAYLSLSERPDLRVKVLDASCGPTLVAEEARDHVTRLVEAHRLSEGRLA